MRLRFANGSRLAPSSTITRSQIQPTVRQLIRISAATAFLEVFTASHAAVSSNATVKLEPCRAHGTAATTTPWRLQLTRCVGLSR